MMAADGAAVTVTTAFTGKKVGCVRWRPLTAHSLSRPSQFICGAYGFECGLQLWSWTDELDDPVQTAEVDFSGDVNCIQHVAENLAVVASSCGHVSLFRYCPDQGGLQEVRRWSGLHRLKGGGVSCTWLSVHSGAVASVGEDGRVNVVDINCDRPVSTIDQADGFSLSRAVHVSSSELLASNVRGQLKVFDLRVATGCGGGGGGGDHSVVTSSSAVQQCAITALCQHPGQHHVCVSGDCDGTLSVWDMRQPQHPAADIGAHSAPVSDVMFHDTNSQHLFSACEDGSLWQWSVAPSGGGAVNIKTKASTVLQSSPENSWLSADANRRQLSVVSLLADAFLPLNSVDVSRQWLVCGGDNSSVHVVNTALH